jgi:hypothetical protein
MSVTDRILTALTTVIRMNDKVEDLAGLMTEQQRRIDDLNGRVIRLETVLEIAINRTPVQTKWFTALDSGASKHIRVTNNAAKPTLLLRAGASPTAD